MLPINLKKNPDQYAWTIKLLLLSNSLQLTIKKKKHINKGEKLNWEEQKK